MDTIFVACDGTQFDDKEECLNYESKINLIDSKDFCLFDEHGVILVFPPRYNTIDKLAESHFFICKTKECANALNIFIENEYGCWDFPNIEPNVVYGYGIDGSEEWKSIKEVITGYESQINKLADMNKKLTSRLS